VNPEEQEMRQPAELLSSIHRPLITKSKIPGPQGQHNQNNHCGFPSPHHVPRQFLPIKRSCYDKLHLRPSSIRFTLRSDRIRTP
jgi:hypothetical protein